MKGWVAPVVACLTLGLAPFVPEPHVVGKLRWVLGGARGMAPIDWFDLVLHGSPWLWLVLVVAGDLHERKREGKSSWRVALLLAALLAALVCVTWSLLG